MAGTIGLPGCHVVCALHTKQIAHPHARICYSNLAVKQEVMSGMSSGLGCVWVFLPLINPPRSRAVTLVPCSMKELSCKCPPAASFRPSSATASPSAPVEVEYRDLDDTCTYIARVYTQEMRDRVKQREVNDFLLA